MDNENDRPLRIHQSVARQIGVSILSGDLPPGHAFPGEIEQSAAMGVSRTAYREAIRILVAKGLLESRPKIGTRVLPRFRWNLLDPDLLAWSFMDEPRTDFTRDLFELRNIIEPAAARLAAERRSEEQLAAMRQALDDMTRHGLAAPAGQAADRLFHRVILEATGNEAVLSLAGSVGAAVQWTTRYKQHAHSSPRDPVPEHETVYLAIKAKDADAAHAAMAKLLQLALDDMSMPSLA